MPTRLTATQLAARLATRELGAREVAQAYLDRIASLDSRIGAFLTIDPEDVLRGADAAQVKIDAGEAGPLTGVPIALKDNLCTAGVRTTCASRILENHIPIYDATVVRRLRDFGCVMLGKTNLDEFAMGTSTENSAFQVTRNPWDLGRSPGGSSGGSAAAVAAEMAPLALGSDTGGSIRQPASLCGIVGFKPTYGRCSRYGLIAFGSSLDQIGPFARTVEDTALLASAITGHDPKDSTSVRLDAIAVGALKAGSLKGARVGVLKETLGDSTDPRVVACVERALDLLRKEGAEVREVSIPTIAFGVTTYYIIAPAEASSNLARFDGVRYGLRVDGKGHIGMMEATRAKGFGHEVKARIMIGTYALSAGYYDAFYLRAQQVRALMRRNLEAAFQDHDILVSPTSPVPAFRLGELSSDPLALKMLDTCTIPANMGGFPALSLNCGFADGLPVGLHLMGPVLGDERLLQLAYCVEQALPDATGRPPLP